MHERMTSMRWKDVKPGDMLVWRGVLTQRTECHIVIGVVESNLFQGMIDLIVLRLWVVGTPVNRSTIEKFGAFSPNDLIGAKWEYYPHEQ